MDLPSDNTNLKIRLAKSKKILIIPKPGVNIDILSASFALAYSLSENDKEISVFIDPAVYKNILQEKFPPKDLQFYKRLPQDDYVVNLNNFNGKVKDVSWKESEGKVKIFVTTENSSIDQENVVITKKPKLPDLTLLVGFNNIELLGEFANHHKSHLNKSICFSIVNSTSTESKTSNNYFIKESSYSQFINNFLQDLDISTSKHTNTIVLAGIISSIKSNQTDDFSLANNLLKNGADIKLAQKISTGYLNLRLLKIIGNLSQNTYKLSSKVFYSQTKASTEIEINLLNEPVPAINFQDSVIAFSVFQLKSKSIVFFKSKKKLQLDQSLIKKWKGEGVDEDFCFETTLELNEIISRLKTDLQNTSFLKENEQTKQTKISKNYKQKEKLVKTVKPEDNKKEKDSQKDNNLEPLTEATSFPEPLVLENTNKKVYTPPINQPLPPASNS